MLQQRGLRIVYTSAVVTSGMRVATEPRVADPRQALDELLRPHGLVVRSGPAGLLQIVRAPRERPKPSAMAKPQQAQPTASTNAPPQVYDEHVFVQAPADLRRDSGVAGESSLTRRAMLLRSGVLASDALYAVQTMPRVAATDDFRSEFSVRGSSARHVGVVLDGIATSALQHAAYGAGDSASLAMINPDVIERATLQAGAYPRRSGDSLGGQLALTMREGSRDRTMVSGSFGGVATALVAEGPLRLAGARSGQALRPARGSWLLSARQSYLDWPTIGFGAEYSGMGFAFRDVQAKAVFDVTSTQQVNVIAVAGQSVGDLGNDLSGTAGILEARHRATLVAGSWRSTLGSATTLTQRVHVVTSESANRAVDRTIVNASHQRELTYRTEIAHAWPQVLLESAAELQRFNGFRQQSAYAHAAWTASPRLTISPGLRVATSTIAWTAAVSPWILGDWEWRPGWTLMASAGIGHQFPVLEHREIREIREKTYLADLTENRVPDLPGLPVNRLADLPDLPVNRLRPEQARYLDVGVQRSTNGLRMQATLFHRSERDVLDERPYRSSLAGRSLGVEALVEYAADAPFTASVAYSFGRSRYVNQTTGERFWADFDQRHALNLFATYRVSRVDLAAAFRTGSNFPIVGYLTSRNGQLFAGERRNEVRRPPYARLDLRASRTLSVGRAHGLTVYVELLNALNRTNFGPADGAIGPGGEAVGFTEKLLPRFLSGGLRIEF